MNRNLKIAYLANLAFSLGLGIYQNFLPLHLRSLGADAIALGQYGSFSMLISSLAYFPATWLCNRYDRKLLIVVGWAMVIPVPLILAWAPVWQWALLASFLYNISLFSNVALQNYIIKNAAPEQLSATFAQVFAAFSLGSVFSQPLGGWLLERIDFFWILMIAAAFYTLSALLYMLIDPDPPGDEERYAPGINLRLPRQHWLLLILFCSIHALCVLPLDFVVTHIRDRAGQNTFWIGIISATASLSGAFGTPQLGKLADRVGIFQALSLNLILAAASFGLMILFPEALPFILIAALLRGTIRSNSLFTASIGRLCRHEERSNLLSLFGFCSGLLVTVCPLLSGVLYEINPDYPFALAAMLTASCGAMLFVNANKLEKVVAKSPN